MSQTFPTPKLCALRQQRSRAIESYARLEQSLCELFAELIGTELKLAGVVFFRLNAPGVEKTIETLLKKKFGGKFRPYWQGNDKGEKGLLNHIRSLAQKRNDIVHWTSSISSVVSLRRCPAQR